MRSYVTVNGKKGGHSHMVNIVNNICCHNTWKTFKISFSHAFAAMASINMDLRKRFQDSFTMKIGAFAIRLALLP